MKIYIENLFNGSKWQKFCEIDIDNNGNILKISENCKFEKAIHQCKLEIGMPGINNSHCHGFQSIFSGKAEIKENPKDDFWSWRSKMYQSALSLDESKMEAIYAYLYMNMVKVGYTSVCEFHYIHNEKNGNKFNPISKLSEAISSSANSSGIGLTLLPVIYQYSDFGRKKALEHQKRFILNNEEYFDLFSRIAKFLPEGQNIGVAFHSLRAVAVEDTSTFVSKIKSLMPGKKIPIHIHISEQEKEVNQCEKIYNNSPIKLLLSHNSNVTDWNLVHGTHISDREIDLVISENCNIVLCPTTEANLGDGIFPYKKFLARGGNISIGSDSNITLNPYSEIQLMEYTERLLNRKRSVLTSEEYQSPAEYLLSNIFKNTEKSTGSKIGKIKEGYRADIIFYQSEEIDYSEDDKSTFLDYLVFHKPHSTVNSAMINGKWVIRNGVHINEKEIVTKYRKIFSK